MVDTEETIETINFQIIVIEKMVVILEDEEVDLMIVVDHEEEVIIERYEVYPAPSLNLPIKSLTDILKVSFYRPR